MSKVAPPESVPWLRNVFLAPETVRSAVSADATATVMASMAADGIETRPVFIPIHQLPPYESTSRFPVADDWSARGLTLPLHPRLTDADVSDVVASLHRAVVALSS